VDGALLIADRWHNRIRRVDPATGVITTIVGSRQARAVPSEPPDPANVRLGAFRKLRRLPNKGTIC
jgi:hypothetical protein